MIEIVERDFDAAWYKINRKFLGAEGERPEDATRAMMCYSFDNLVTLHGRPRCNLDPGILVNYHKAKWAHLLRSYMDWEQLEYLKNNLHTRMAKPGDHSIPLGYSFKPSIKSNGSCLIGFSFLVDKKRGTINVNIHTRVAEVTRRMMMDYILFYKLFRKLFFKTEVWAEYEWKINLYYQMMYQSAMFVPILHTVFPFEEMGISTTGRIHKGYIGRVEREIEVCMSETSKGSGFAQMKKIRDLVAADMRGEPRTSINIKKLRLTPKGVRKVENLRERRRLGKVKAKKK